VLLRAKCEGVDIDTRVRGTGVVLVGLDKVEVSSLALREAVLTVKLELGGNNRVLTPAVHVKGRLSKDKSTCIRDTRVECTCFTKVSTGVSTVGTIPECCTSSGCTSGSTGVIESSGCIDECLGVKGNCLRATEGVESVGESINCISVVERLGTKNAEKVGAALEGRAVIYAVILLDNPYELLARVVEVELNLVGR
jgi:hypothetical protein